jgi:hypothetical protein
MPDEPGAKLLLIVTGSMLRAEEADRPLAYYLQQQIETLLSRLDPASPALAVRVVADFRWLHDEPLQTFPTISIGGPGVNALAQRWLEELPLSLAVDDHYYIQMDPDLEEPHASVWGMDNPDTQIAVSLFLQRFLPRFLERSLALAPDLPDLDDIEAEAEDEDDEDDE